MQPRVRAYSLPRVTIDLSKAESAAVMRALADYACRVHDSEAQAEGGVAWSVARELNDALGGVPLVWRGK